MGFLGNIYAKRNPKRLVLGLEQTCSLPSGTAVTTALFWLCILPSWPFCMYLWARDVSVLSRPIVSNGEDICYSTVQTINTIHSGINSSTNCWRLWKYLFFINFVSWLYYRKWLSYCILTSSFKQTNSGVLCEPVAKNPVNWWWDLFEQGRSFNFEILWLNILCVSEKWWTKWFQILCSHLGIFFSYNEVC